MRLSGSKRSPAQAKAARKTLSLPEALLWRELKGDALGLRFRSQHDAGPYRLDFYCAPAKLCIEVDGEAHGFGNRPDRDERRDAWLMEQGVLALRFPAQEVLDNLEGVVRQIALVLAERMQT